MTFFLKAKTDLAVISVLATLPLVWIRLAQAGPLAMKPVHVALLLVFARIVLSRQFVSIVSSYAQISGRFALAYLAFLVSLAISLLWTDSVGIERGLSQIVKQLIFVMLAFLYGTYLTSLSKDKLVSTFLWAGLSAYVFFALAAHIAHARQGQNALANFITIMMQGDWNALNYVFFPTIFRGFSYDITYEAIAGLKHDVTNGLFLGFVMFQIGSQSLIRNHKIRVSAHIAIVIAALLMGIVIVSSLSRSTLLCLLIAFALVWLVRISQTTSALKLSLSRLIFGMIILSTVVALGFAFGDKLADYIISETGSYKQRLDIYQLAINSIETNALLGVGKGWPTGHDAVHNFFLRSWYHSGLLALFLSVTFYFYALAHWLTTITRYITQPGWWVSPLDAPWVFALPVLPLVRALFTSTDFILSQWFCFATYFACLAINEKLKNDKGTAAKRTK